MKNILFINVNKSFLSLFEKEKCVMFITGDENEAKKIIMSHDILAVVTEIKSASDGIKMLERLRKTGEKFDGAFYMADNKVNNNVSEWKIEENGISFRKDQEKIKCNPNHIKFIGRIG